MHVSVRGPWRLKAFLDQKGHPVTSRFLVIRPSDRNCALETVWAICNSPFANAYSYAFSGKRDILAGRVRELPLPRMDGVDLRPLIQAVRSYFKAARDAPEASRGAAIEEELRVLHWRIDAEVLRLYQLPEQLEHQVLMLFSGVPRRFQWYIAEGMLSLPTAKWSMVISFFSGVMASGFAFGCAKDTVEFFNAGIGEVRFPVGEGFLLVIFDYVGPWV